MRACGIGFALCAYTQIALSSVATGAPEPDSYPSRPVRMITPGGASSNLDYRARQLAQKLSAAFRQPFVVDNRPGANSIIGTDIAARAAPDGHTLLFGYHAIAMNPHLYKKLPYDASKQLTPVVGFNTGWVGIYVHATVPVSSLKEFIEFAKLKQDDLNCVSTGNGSGQHLSCHVFNTLTGSRLRVIHFKELGQALTAMLSGQVAVGFDGLPLLLGPIRAGKLKALAMSGPNRIASLPSVPTFREAGLPQFEMVFWTGVFAPAGTPRTVISRINRETNIALKAPDIQQSFIDTGATSLGGSDAEFAEFVKSQSQKWRAVIVDSGAQLD